MTLKSSTHLLAGTALCLLSTLAQAIEGPEPEIPKVVVIPPVIQVEEPKPEPDRTNVDAIVSAVQSGVPLTAAQCQFLMTLSDTILQDINARLFRLRAGVTLNADGTFGAGGPTGAGRDGKEAKSVPEAPFLRWEIFAAGHYGNFDLNDQGDRAGFESNTWVGTIGAEYHLDRHISLGLAASWADGSADLSRKIGSIDAEGLALTAYGSAVWDNFYVDLLYSFGTFDQDIRRNTFTSGTSRGDTHAMTNAIQFNTGYIMKLGQLHTGPIASLSWIHGDIDGYRETGGGDARLTIPEQDADSLISQVGWTASYAAPTNFGSFIPQIRASWDHEFLNSAESVSATLQQSPFANGGRYTATGQGAESGRDYLNLGAGIGARFGNRASVTLDYQTHLFQQRTTAHFASIKVEFAF
jgi:uncharacterized protein YhjY with autotransporter beta-barrel domain